VETFIQNTVTYLFGNIRHPFPFFLRQEEGGHLWGKGSVPQAVLTEVTRRAVTRTHHLVFVMTNEQIAASTFHYVYLVLICLEFTSLEF